MEIIEAIKAIAAEALPYFLALALAFVTEGGVEYILGTPFNKIPKLSGWKWALMYVSLGVGLALAFLYHLDLFAVLSGGATGQGIVLTGVAVGRGAQYVHDLVSKYILVK